jgi:hypothetical protein
MNDEAIKVNDDFMSMSNTDFEVLFDALNRTHEVQFRTLFTPLAQTNMVDLILSKIGYGDDFHFFKNKRTNTIITNHSQSRNLLLNPAEYTSYSFDIIKEKFTYANAEFFKAVYFDFAPLLAIPIYQDKPVHSLKPIPDYTQTYAHRECESISNRVNLENIAHPRTKTNVILKSTYINSKDGTDEICVDAYSYDIENRVDFVSVFGGDGYFHNVAVPWDEYIPLQAQNNFYVSGSDNAPIGSILARKNNICIYK